MYSPQVMNHFRSPRNRGPMPGADAEGRARYPRCGDRMVLRFRLEDDRVREVRFESWGCGPARAAASVATELLEGRSVEAARNLNAFELDRALGGLPPAKRHALLMVLECLAQALGPRTAGSASAPAGAAGK